MASGTLTPEQLKQYQGITDPNKKFQFLQGVGTPANAPTSTPPSINGSHSVGSYTSPPPVSDPSQAQIDDLRKQYDTTANPATRDAIHQQVAALEASRGGVYDKGTGTYSYTNQQPSGGATGGQPAYMPPDNSALTDSITKGYMNDLAAQTQAINQQLAAAIQASNLAVGQNKQLLEEQIAKLHQQKQINDQNAITLQNRRGGFYSGGLDYQLGNIASSNTQAQEGVTRDINARNADIYGRNALLAQQAAQNIGMLQSQAPDKIRQLVNEAIQQQQQNARADAALTGVYNGSPTLAAQNQEFNQGIAQAGLTGNYNGQRTLEGQQVDVRNTQIMAALTGFLPNGQPTTAEQQRQLDNEWTTAEKIGQITPTLSMLYGLPPGTPTQAAKEFAMQHSIAQQNADTSRMNANTSAKNATTSANNSANSQNNARVNQLLDVWRNTGKAPAGLEQYGVQQGTPYYDPVAERQTNTPAEPDKNDVISTYVSNIDRMTQDKRVMLFKDEKAAIIKDIGVTGYNQLYDMYFDQYGKPKE